MCQYFVSTLVNANDLSTDFGRYIHRRIKIGVVTVKKYLIFEIFQTPDCETHLFFSTELAALNRMKNVLLRLILINLTLLVGLTSVLGFIFYFVWVCGKTVPQIARISVWDFSGFRGL